jgi:hypothetical protein
MLLPVFKNSSALTSVNKPSIEEIIRNSAKALQHMSAAMPGSGVSGGAYLGFNGKTGVWTLAKEEVAPESLGRIVVPYHGMYELIVEWGGGGRPLQKTPPRQLLGIDYDEPLSERMLTKPLSPHLYRKETDGPKHTFGFIGFMVDDGANVIFEHSSNGAKKAFNALATIAHQAVIAFGEMVHPTITLSVGSWEGDYGTIYEPKFNGVGFITDTRVKEVSVISDADIITRPTASKAKLARKAAEAPAI